MAGAKYCCSNRLILLGLKEPAGRGTWWGRSGRIKCCLEIAQGIGRRGQGRYDTPETRHTHTHTHTHTKIRHDETPVTPRTFTQTPPHTQPHREGQTGKAVRNVRALSLLHPHARETKQITHTHTHICAHGCINTETV